MIDDTTYISQLKSLSIVSTSSKKSLLLSSESLLSFQDYLETQMSGEVLVVSTNLGMEIFYISLLDYSEFIKKAAIPCIDKAESDLYTFTANSDGIAVYESFAKAIQVFAKYPQIFLAYSKKFLFLLKRNKQQIQLTATLSLFYHIALENLKTAGSVPHLQRIETLYDAINLKTPSGLRNFLQEKLAKTLLAKVHSN